MLTPPANAKIHLHLPPVDMRLAFDRLAALARDVCRADPLSGHLFVFRSRRRDRVKILYRDRDGMALWYKRLEKGSFPFPEPSASRSALVVTPIELSLLLDGIDLATANLRRPRRRFVPETHS